jgi:hypothetical protein
MKESKNNINKIETLHSIIDELRIESRKLEYSSALQRLTRRVDTLEEQIKVLVAYVKKR